MHFVCIIKSFRSIFDFYSKKWRLHNATLFWFGVFLSISRLGVVLFLLWPRFNQIFFGKCHCSTDANRSVSSIIYGRSCFFGQFFHRIANDSIPIHTYIDDLLLAGSCTNSGISLTQGKHFLKANFSNYLMSKSNW